MTRCRTPHAPLRRESFEAGQVDITLHLNGEPVRLAVEPRTSLLDVLREQVGLTGTKKGCDHGHCGACTVHIDGARVSPV